HTESLLRVSLLDAGFPEANALGKPILTPRTGKQFGEEIGVQLVVRTQALEANLGCGRCGLARGRRSVLVANFLVEGVIVSFDHNIASMFTDFPIALGDDLLKPTVPSV